jgi:hypothetical protein
VIERLALAVGPAETMGERAGKLAERYGGDFSGEFAEELVARGSQALDLDGDLQESRRQFEAAYQTAEHNGDTHAMAAAVLGLGGLWVHEHRTAAAGALLDHQLRQALSLVDPRSPLALRLRARLAAETDYRTGGHAAILAVLAEARRGPDPVARVEALSLAHHCLLGPDHDVLRRELAVELVGESHRTVRRSDLLMGLLWHTVDLFLGGEPHAERRLGELRGLLSHDSHLAVGYVVGAIEVMLAIRAGEFARAEAMAWACAERGVTAGDADATGWYGAQLVAIRWYQGRIGELVPMLTELVHSPTLSAVDNSYFGALAVAAATAGDRRAAASALATLCGRDLAEPPRSSTWLVAMNGAVEAAYLLDDAGTAARAYELLRPYAHLPMMASLGVACFGSVHQALGVAALTTGELDLAVEHLSEAVRHNLALRHWPAVATARLRYAQALARRGRSGDAAVWRQARAVAAQEAVALGIPVPDDAGVSEPPELPAVCTRQGRTWRVDWGHRGVVVEHSVGMLHLAVLLANPGREIRAVDLARGPAELGGAGAGELTGGSAQPVLDRVARQEYSRRLETLRAEIDDLDSAGDRTGAARAREERDWLIAELAAATGIGGRPRHFPDSEEKARIAVGKAIRRALRRIADADALIGAHLQASVSTGIRCSYRPA